MKSLLIDQGNTNTKIYVYQEEKSIHHIVCKELSIEILTQLLNNFSFTYSIIASVKEIESPILLWLQANSTCINFDFTTPIPIQNNYQSPKTLGIDRLANAVAAFAIFPNQNCLVIDAGTCITYDFIDSNGIYQGGAISLGLLMRFQALHTLTAKLPLVTNTNNLPSLIAKNTNDAILSGVNIGIIKEVDGFIDEYQNQYPNLKVIVCGGDTTFFDSRLKNSIFARPDLLAIGLYTILKFNVQ